MVHLASDMSAARPLRRTFQRPSALSKPASEQVKVAERKLGEKEKSDFLEGSFGDIWAQECFAFLHLGRAQKQIPRVIQTIMALAPLSGVRGPRQQVAGGRFAKSPKRPPATCCQPSGLGNAE
jgi:hypothetical protein